VMVWVTMRSSLRDDSSVLKTALSVRIEELGAGIQGLGTSPAPLRWIPGRVEASDPSP
jgi:hypothetical protein